MKKLDLLEKVGGGTYSDVYALSEEGHLDNVLKRNFAEKDVDFSYNVTEMDMLARLRGHPFILTLNRVCFGNPFRSGKTLTPRRSNQTRDDSIFFFLERMNLSLKLLMYNSELNEDYFVWVRTLMCQLLLALEFIHANNIVHRDIKPDNILINEITDEARGNSIYLKLADFGISKTMFNMFPSTPGTVTSWYRAPEIACGKQYGSPVDIWSTGCVFYEAVSREPLVIVRDESCVFDYIYKILEHDMTQEELEYLEPKLQIIHRKIVRKSYQDRASLEPELETTFNNSYGPVEGQPPGVTHSMIFFDLITKMLDPLPDKRWTATQCLGHPFFASMTNIIEQTRRMHPPTKINDLNTNVEVHACQERKWIGSVASSMRSHGKLTDRMIFHSIALFDRYLVFLRNNGPINKVSATHMGRYMGVHDCIRSYYGCLYLSYKYFMSIGPDVYNWKDLFPESFTSLFDFEKAKDFEQELIEYVLKYRIYEFNVLEVLSHFPSVSEENITTLFINYLNFSEDFRGTVRELYNKLL